MSDEYKEKAVGGYDVCFTCAAHCEEIFDLLARIEELESPLVLNALMKSNAQLRTQVRDLEEILVSMESMSKQH